MKAIRDRCEASGGDLGCQLAVQRPEDSVRVEVIARERDNLFGGVHPFVRPAGNKRLSAASVWLERSFELALHSSNVGLSCVAEEARTVVGEIEAVCRH